MRPLLLLIALVMSVSVLRAQTAVNDSFNVPVGEVFSVSRTLSKADFNTGSVPAITFDSLWSYHDDLQNSLGRNDFYPLDAEGDVWNSTTFNTATSTVPGWKLGALPLVAGGIDAVTNANVVLAGIASAPNGQNLVNTYLFRNTFTATTEQVVNPVWLLRIIADDGAIVYLNGVEVSRLNMATANFTPAGALTPATFTANGSEAAYSSFALNLSGIVRPGINTIAVEVHQTSLASSDTGLDLSLTPGLSGESGFTYADSIFGTNLPDSVTGALAPTEGQSGTGALRVSITNFVSQGGAPNSGGWSGTVSVPSTGNYRLNLAYRLSVNIANNRFNTNYGEAVLTVNGTRFGNGAGTSLDRYTRTVNQTGSYDSPWQSVSMVVPMNVGSNTIQLGVFHTDNFVNMSANAWFDDLTVTTENIVGVLANDTGSNLSALLVNGTTKGALALASDGGFSYFANEGSTGTDSFTYRAVSGLNQSAPATVTLNLSKLNYNPVALPDSYNVSEDSVLTVPGLTGLLANDTDRNPEDVLTSVLVAGPAVGTLSLQPTGAFTYTPPANYFGNVTFTYQASDGSKTSATTIVTVKVSPVNDTPAALAETYATNTNLPLVVTDPGRAHLFYRNDFDTVVAPALAGSGSLLPVDAFGGLGSGTNTFSGDFLRVTSGGNPGQAAELTLTGLPAHNFVNLGFLLAVIDSWDGSNGPDSFNVEVDGAVVLSAGFANASAAAQTYAAPAASILALRQDLGFSTGTLFVDSAYDASLFPELQNIPHTASTLTIRFYGSGAGWLGSDDESFALDNLAVRLKSSLGSGSTTPLVSRASNWKHKSSAIDLGTTWSGKDFNDAAWASGPAPLGFGDPVTTTVPANGTLPFQTVYFRREFTLDTPAAVTALAGTVRRDDGAVIYLNGVELARSNMNTGTVIYSTGAATSVGNADETAYFNYTGLSPALGALVVGRNVIAVEVHQFGSPTTSSDITFDLDLTATLALPQGLLANDTDADTGDDLFAEVVTPPAKGTLALHPSGAFTYTPNPNVSGTDTFTYRVRDFLGAFSAPVTVTFNVVPGANNVPAAVADSYSVAEDSSLSVLAISGLLANDSDPEADPMTALLVAAPTVGTLNLSGDGSFTYAPPANYSGAVTFTYRINDTFGNSGPATVTLNVTPVNDLPIALVDRYFTASSLTLTVNAANGVLANDTDIDAGDTRTAVLVSNAAHGTLALAPDGSFTYTPVAGFGGVDQFTYQAKDSANAPSNVVSVFLEINGTPVGQNDAYAFSEDVRFSTAPVNGVLANDSDPDAGQAISALLATLPGHGSVLLRSDGSFNYTPAANYNGPDSFTYRLTDGRQTVGPFTVSLTIAPVLDAPDVRDDSYETHADTALVVTALKGLLSNDRSIEGGSLTAALATLPLHGTATVNTDGSFTYTPTAGYFGADLFTYTVSEPGVPVSLAATVSIDVKSANELVRITEIMFNPAILTAAERTAGRLTNNEFEWFEIHNTGTSAVSLATWTVSSGVSYTFPAGATLAPDARAVVAASEVAFRSRYPSYAGLLFAGWTGTLSNNSNSIALSDPLGTELDKLTYADSGAWSSFLRSTLLTSGGYNSWEWSSMADGDGRTLELVNGNWSNNYGGNWLASAAVGGTPGAVNSRAAANVAPVIEDLVSSPVSPRSTDAVTVSVRVRDESDTSAPAVSLRWRVSTQANTNSFATIAMRDDGVSPDTVANDGFFAATIPAQANGRVIEYFVIATDAALLSRVLGGSLDGSGNNPGPYLLYLVDDLAYTGIQPLYRLIMTEFDRNAFRNTIVRTTDVAITCTLVVQDGADYSVRHQCTLRNRGAGSRGRTPYTMRLDMPSDHPLNGSTGINLNSQFPAAAVLGNRLSQLAGLPAPDARQIAVRVNVDNVNSIRAGTGVDFVPYAHVQPLDSDFLDMAFPGDTDGNIYTKRRPANGSDTKWAYLSGNAEAYAANGWQKGNNSGANDWSDVDTLHAYLNNTNGVSPTGTGYAATMDTIMDVNQWVSYFATHTLLYNLETSLSTGIDDDYDAYRSALDGKFRIIPHDFDTVLNQGDTPGSATGTLFPMIDPVGSSVPGTVMKRLMEDNIVCRRYYAELLRLGNGLFEPTSFNSLADNYLAGNNNTAVTVASMKTFANARRNHIISQIKTALTVTHNLTVTNGFPTTTTPATIILSGNIPMATTATVRVNGVTVPHVTKAGTWSTGDTFPVNLAPGFNPLTIQCLDESGTVVASSVITIVYDNASNTAATVAASGTTTWTAAASPHRVTGVLSVPVAATLVIEPGATVYFADGASLNVGGRVSAVGTTVAPITLTRLPASTGKWNGLTFSSTLSDNRLENIRLLHGDGGAAWITLSSAKLTAVSAIFDNPGASAPVTAKPVIFASHPTLAVSKCSFPSGSVPVLQGTGLSGTESFVIETNTFAATPVFTDVLTFSDAHRPGPIPVISGNTFSGCADDLVDLADSDALVEGNTFRNAKLDQPRATTANAISATGNSHVFVVRNTILDSDHAVTLLNGARATYAHNTAVNLTVAGLNFAEGGIAGFGAEVSDSIFSVTAALTANSNLIGNQANLSFVRSVVPTADLARGTDLRSADPLFLNVSTANYGVRFESVAKASSALALDLGSGAKAGVVASPVPVFATASGSASFTVGGPGITAYRWRSGTSGAWSAETPLATPLTVSSLPVSGTATIQIEGLDFTGRWTPDVSALTLSWLVNITTPPVRLSEILAVNDGTVGDGVSDYVELVSFSDLALDLSGFRLSDSKVSALEPAPFTFAAGTTLPARGRLVLSSIQLGFNLAESGETIRLLGPLTSGDVAFDTLTYGWQLAGYSTSLRADGQWVAGVPTLGSPHRTAALAAPSAVRINEWLARGGLSYEEDFVELHNSSALPVLLSTLRLSDSFVASAPKHIFAAGSLLPPVAFRAFRADGKDDGDHLTFKMAYTTGHLVLTDSVLGVEADRITYTTQEAGISQGRSPDSGTVFAFLNPPTPGFSNALSPSEALLINNLRITELMYAPPGDADAEFIEFTNIGASPLDLAGVRIVNGVTFTFPTGSTLAAGASGVIVRSTASFANAYGSSATVLGTYTGRLDNGGEQVRLETPRGLGILDFTYDPTWHPASAGLGSSLEVVNQNATAGSWNFPTQWRASLLGGGSPGGSVTLSVEAGENSNLALPATGVLRGVVSSDVPVTSLVTTWSQLGGPATASLDSPDQISTYASFPLAGTYLFRLSITSGTTVKTDEVQVTVTSSGVTYSSWQSSRFTAGQLADPLVSGPDADPDNDGVPNLVELLLGRNPLGSDAGAPPVLKNVGGVLVFDYPRPSDTNLTIEAQWGATATGPWFTGAGYITETTLSDDGTTRLVRVQINGSRTEPRQFIRLRLVNP